MEDKIIKILERRHPECFYKPATFKVDREILVKKLLALFTQSVEEIIGEDSNLSYHDEGVARYLHDPELRDSVRWEEGYNKAKEEQRARLVTLIKQ